ncbi:hypothetical protein OC845_005325 [Tilletia horrida]|nr:hypothetical protein OC845_005325 [Tilletia horrida]
MSTNKNPGNFANRPREQVVAAGIAGGHHEGHGSAAKHAKEAHDKIVAEGGDPHAPTGVHDGSHTHDHGHGRGHGHGHHARRRSPKATASYAEEEETVLVEEYEDEVKYEEVESGGGEHKPKRGFAAMPKDKLREIASKGGHASHRGHGSKDEHGAKGEHGSQGGHGTKAEHA